jgi:hypothetical protein
MQPSQSAQPYQVPQQPSQDRQFQFVSQPQPQPQPPFRTPFPSSQLPSNGLHNPHRQQRQLDDTSLASLSMSEQDSLANGLDSLHFGPPPPQQLQHKMATYPRQQ